MKFASKTPGGIVPTVAAAAPDDLPAKLRAHPAAAAFLAAANEAAAEVADMHADAPDTTGDGTAEALRKVEAAARRMQAAMLPMADGSEASRTLHSTAHYLLQRTREGSIGATGRPAVPAMHTTAADAQELLQRLHADLAALRTACGHAAAQIKPRRSMPKGHERQLVVLLADAHRQHFGTLPPARGWFLPFAQDVAARIGLSLGRRVIVDAITEL